MSEDDNPDSSGQNVELVENPYLDAANRLERQIEKQVTIINSIDDKSEHVTRLVGILIGLVFSVLSIASNYGAVKFDDVHLAIILTFILGIGWLLMAMGAAIVTYLSSRFRIGLHHSVGYYLSDPEEAVAFETHIRRVCGSYGEVIEENKKVIEKNSARFRWALFSVLLGVLFLATTGTLYLGGISASDSWIGLVVSILLSFAAGYYILTGKYLTLESLESTDG